MTDIPQEEIRITQTGDDELEMVEDAFDGAEEEPFVYSEDEPNLVKAFKSHPEGEEELKRISRLVRDNYDEAFDGTAEYRERKKKDWEILIGNLPAKTGKFQGGANTHVPFMLENVTRNSFRAFSEIFGDWQNVYGVAALGPNDEVMAQVLTLHGNWQIRQQIPDFKRQMFRGILTFFTSGDLTCHSWFDTFKKQNRHETLTCDDFFVPYTYTATMPDWSDVPWRIKVQMMYPQQLEERQKSWEGVEELLEKKPSFDDGPEMEAHVDVAENEGMDIDETSGSAPYKVLWWEGWLELPNQERRRWCRVMADHDSDTVFELALHEEPDWQDMQRYESQMGELENFRSQMQAQSQFMQEQQMMMADIQQRAMQAQEMGMDASVAESELAQAQQMLSQVAPPPAPTWMQNPEDPGETPPPVKKVPIQLFAHGVCIEPTVGNLGIGYGHMQADFNRAGNIALQQFTDSATGNNLWSLICAEGVEFDGKDQLNLEWGKLLKLTGTSGDDIRKAIMPFKPDPANPQLIEVVRMMGEYASSSMQSPSVMSGDPGKSGETFRGITARIEQATKQLSVSSRKYADFLEQILKNNAKLNATFLDDEEFFQVALQSGSPFWQISQTPEQGGKAFDGAIGAQFKIGRKMYERNYHVEIRADLRFVSQSQKIQEADELVMMSTKIPILQQNQAFQYEAVKKALLARGRNDMVAVLGPQPPVAGSQPPQPQPGAQPGAPPQPGPQNGAPVRPMTPPGGGPGSSPSPAMPPGGVMR